MTNNKIGVLTQRMDRGESDLRNAEGRISALENCHSEIQVSLAKLPTKEDFAIFTKEIRECREKDQKRVDTLYTRDAFGTVATAVIGGIGILIASLRK